MNRCCYYFDGPWKVKALCYYHVTYVFQSKYTLCNSLMNDDDDELFVWYG